MRLFDAHCHLQDERLASDVESVWTRARDAGVAGLICCGTEEGDWPAVERLCGAIPEAIPAFGLHPWRARGRSGGWLDALRSFLGRNPAALVGEIGLDHALTERNDEEQWEVCLAQWRLAKELQRPVCLHCRRAWERLLAAVREIAPLSHPFLIHSYSGSSELIPALSDAGAYFSFSGAITRSGNRRGRAAAAAVPLERLLAETDAPDLTPIRDGKAPDRAEANEPCNLGYVVRTVAEIRTMDAEGLSERLWENSMEFVGKKGLAPAAANR